MFYFFFFLILDFEYSKYKVINSFMKVTWVQGLQWSSNISLLIILIFRQTTSKKWPSNNFIRSIFCHCKCCIGGHHFIQDKSVVNIRDINQKTFHELYKKWIFLLKNKLKWISKILPLIFFIFISILCTICKYKFYFKSK